MICVILGCVVGSFMPTVGYEYSKYLAIAIMAALDSIIGVSMYQLLSNDRTIKEGGKK